MFWKLQNFYFFLLSSDSPENELAMKCRSMGTEVNDCRMHTTLFADDPLILAEEEVASCMVRNLTKKCTKWEPNMRKTKYMTEAGAGLHAEYGTCLLYTSRCV